MVIPKCSREFTAIGRNIEILAQTTSLAPPTVSIPSSRARAGRVVRDGGCGSFAVLSFHPVKPEKEWKMKIRTAKRPHSAKKKVQGDQLFL
jgi:hypothetical protein